MITKEAISKVIANVKNNQMLNILAEHLRLTQSDSRIFRFIEMCLCDNNEIKSCIKTKDDFDKMKILEIIDKLEIMKELGYPVLLGTSRKSVIGLTLDLPVEEREEGTMVTTVYGVQKGCAFVRVHDVEKNKRAIRMTRALMREHEV